VGTRKRQEACGESPDVGKGPARALKGATLALICERPGHGYDLANRLRHRLGPAWQVRHKAVYDILNQLERAGLVTPREESNEHRRQRRVVYHPSPLAHAALERWRDGEVRKEALRSDVRARLATVPVDDVERVLRILDEYEDSLLELIEATADDRPPQVATWNSLLVRVTHSGTDLHLQAEHAWIVDTRRRFGEYAQRPMR
jgi:DNA-binding PadR family transcriptional regulator